MNVLLVAQWYYPERNGITSIVTLLAEGLVRRGLTVTVATQACANRLTNSHNGVSIRQFRITGDAVQGMAGEVPVFRAFVAQGTRDVVHIHHIRIWTFDALMDWLPRRSCPLVLTPHGFQYADSSSWQRYYQQFRQEALPHLDHVTCLSPAFEEVPLLNRWQYDRHSVVRNGVDLTRFAAPPVLDLRRVWQIKNRYWVLNVSNHVGVKNHPALHRLARQLPTAVVCHVGNPISTARFGLDRLGVKSGCHYRCQLTARLLPNFQTRRGDDQAVVRAALGQADVFVLPSIREVSPVVILEAMAAGLPWVSCNAGNVGEHRGGVVVQTEPEMADPLTTLRYDKPLARKLGEEGRAHALTFHDADQITDTYLVVYRQTLARFYQRPAALGQ
jgi:L-malate glycosyltransferase